jgi:hypothetical protein
MNFGPLEFAAYLDRKQKGKREPATVEAARAAAPERKAADQNLLTVISGSGLSTRVPRGARVEAVSVYEAVAMRVPSEPRTEGPVKVLVRTTQRPVVLVLSSHQAVAWEIAVAPGATLAAVLVSGYGASTVSGAGDASVSSIGGFYAFKRGSAEFKHLETEVMRCTGRRIEVFESQYAGNSFEVGGLVPGEE